MVTVTRSYTTMCRNGRHQQHGWQLRYGERCAATVGVNSAGNSDSGHTVCDVQCAAVLARHMLLHLLLLRLAHCGT
jgi:hypothetical protein